MVDSSRHSASSESDSDATDPEGTDPQRIVPVDAPAPPANQIYQSMMYSLSIPERALRSTAAIVSGATAGSAGALIPQAFQNSKTYRTFVQQMIDFLANDVGGVQTTTEPGGDGTNGEGDPEVNDYVARKTVGSFVDLAGLATLHVSPLTILAILSDVAHGSQYYLQQLADELKREGVIPEDSTIRHTADLLGAIGAASAQGTDALDTPPIDLAALQQTLTRTRDGIARIDPAKAVPQAEIKRLWNDMTQLATREHVSLFELSSALSMYSMDQLSTAGRGTISTVRVTGNLINQHLVNHYRQGIADIGEQGIYQVISDHSRPYLDAVWFNFAADRPTLTEDVVSGAMLGRLLGGVRGWFAGTAENFEPTHSPGDSPPTADVEPSHAPDTKKDSR